MNYKDTIIKTHNPQILPEINQYQIELLHQQAKISFAAGYEQRKQEIQMTTLSLAEMCEEHRQSGRKEVVEWMKEVKIMELMSYNFQCILKPALNKKIEEWGL